ncbi:MAG TPA: HEAT repeat domain-containing protein [Geothrix sp.]
MAALLRHIPLTPLDELRACLGSPSESDTVSQARLYQLLRRLGQLALPELGSRLVKPTSPVALKRFILGLTAKFDWPEWVPWLAQALALEPDLSTFDEGCAALGRLETRAAREALLKLATQRTDADRQLILRRELSALEAQQPLSFYLGRLLEGDSNPRLAHQGARGLAATAEPDDFPALWEAMDGADPLAFRLLLRAVAELPGQGPNPSLVGRFQETIHTLEDLEALEALTHRLQTVARNAAKAELAQAILVRMEPKAPEAAGALRQALEAGEAGQPAAPLEHLRASSRGPYERFLTEALTVLLEGKVARFNAMVTEAQDTAAKQQASQGIALNQICDALVRRVVMGHLPAAEILPILQEALAHFTHSEGLDYAFCRLVPASDEAGLARILAMTDPKRREGCLDVLGAREEDTLVPFFLKAMQDPIVEVGQRAMHHFGRLPSSFPAVMALFNSGQPDQVRTALRIFTENGTKAAAEPLMAFLRTDGRDDLLQEGVEALGAIRSPVAIPVLLDLLHDGKPARLQEALVEALAVLATPEAGLGLLAKATHLKLPQVLIVALEGTLAAFPGFERALPQDALPALEQLITRCCDDREGEGQRLRAILATQHLYCFDQNFYVRLKEAFSDFLFELRTKGDWDRDTNDRVAAVVKELGRRSASLGHIASKEEEIRVLMQAVPTQGPGRAPALLTLREALQDPEFIMRAELAQELALLVQAEFARKDQDWREQARLCELAGLTRQPILVEPLKELFNRATGLGLRSAAKEALLAMGLDEHDISRRAPIHTILLLEPSAFFRKRLLAVLGSAWDVREAGSRLEAAPMLTERPVDLLISEVADGTGDLRPWLKMQCETRRCRQVLLSTAARDTAAAEPWVLGTLYKPYPPEQLLKALEP